MTLITVMGLSNRTMPKFMTWLIIFVFVTYIIYTLKLVSSNSRSCDDDPLFTTTHNRLVSLQSFFISININSFR
ncbi:hypothetical protein HYC85_015526 [Camellia sinensis]|uniref:Uncharacterized protein n=1 Tax=Camellia sinensis TaxID=4442 RepID=A0A7J7H0W4_CAMSI|nr:hypothetical protein HYC85_015526 [Camellia sinensis]